MGAQLDDSLFIAACTPSRLNFESDPSAVNPRNGNYGGSFGDYFGWRDLSPYPPLYQDFFGLHTGLLAADGRASSVDRPGV